MGSGQEIRKSVDALRTKESHANSLISKVMPLVLLLVTPGLGWAQATQTEILKEISHDKLRSLLQGMGFDFTDNSTDKIITFRF